MNYFEMLAIPESETDEQVIAAAYQQARVKWQALLNQGVGQQQQQARELMNGQLEDAHGVLSNPARRQQHLRELKLARESGTPVGSGRVKVSFSLSNGHADHEFLVVENPVRHPLDINGLSVESLQEYVCRAWEDPGMALGCLQDRTLERWLHYAAGEDDVVTAMRYFRWDPDSPSANSLLFMILDLLQTRYPAPIMPRSQPDLLARLPDLCAPQWRVTPQVINFGLLTAQAPRTIPLFVRTWGRRTGKIGLKRNHAAIKITASKSADHVDVSVEEDALGRGEVVATTITLTSERLGQQQVPVFAARPNRLRGNRELGEQINLKAGEAAFQGGAYRDAFRFFRLAQAPKRAAQAQYRVIRLTYERHDWFGVVQLAQDFNDRYGRQNADIQLWLVEALRMIGGSIFQLGEYRRSLEYLATLACETAFLPDRTRLSQSWSALPEAQINLSAENPKEDWVAVTEAYGLNWTHPSGRADGSHYAGEVPLDLSARRIIWRTSHGVAIDPPLIAYEGVLVGRSRDYRCILGMDAASGAILWEHTVGLTGSRPAAPVAGEGLVFLADPAGGLYALEIVSGEMRWTGQLEDGRDVALTYEEGFLYVGIGKRLVIFDATSGEQVAQTAETKAFFGLMDSNPLNILVSDGCCLFQKVGGANPTMVFLEAETGSSIEFPMPVSQSVVGTLVGSLLGGSASHQLKWAALAGEIFVPCIVSKQIEHRYQTRDSEGRLKEEVERHYWWELHFFVYNARHTKQLAHVWEVTSGAAYRETRSARVSITNITPADALAVTPTYIEMGEERNVYYPPQPDKPSHRLVAAAFGRAVYYWISTDRTVKRTGYRWADSNVQAIAYLGRYDMVTTANSVSTSFVGNLSGGDSTQFVFPSGMGTVVGSPAIYGDVIYVTTREGEIVAIGR